VPCYNEENILEESLNALANNPYPNKEIIAINDGSKDKTSQKLTELLECIPSLRVLDCEDNRGKANALILGAHAANAEYLVCVDADAYLDDEAIFHMVANFYHSGERLGAVTGNPRIRNRDTLLAKLQILEYASIIGAIKRTQRIIGKVLTVSGVVVTFRKKALIDVGLWDTDMITEDIAVSWKLHRRFWDIRYEPKALCWMLVPETLTGLWKQRLRWAQGGIEVLFRHVSILKDFRYRRLWPIYIEQWTSLLWSYAWLTTTILLVLSQQSRVESIFWLNLNAFFLVNLSVFQTYSSLQLDSEFDDVRKVFFYAPWYPFGYWIFNAFVSVIALPKAILSRLKKGDALWTSPDRGFRKL
jgi:biofilm PGA synthesis N-glycosyltransferase PgaC